MWSTKWRRLGAFKSRLIPTHNASLLVASTTIIANCSQYHQYMHWWRSNFHQFPWRTRTGSCQNYLEYNPNHLKISPTSLRTTPHHLCGITLRCEKQPVSSIHYHFHITNSKHLAEYTSHVLILLGKLLATDSRAGLWPEEQSGCRRVVQRLANITTLMDLLTYQSPHPQLFIGWTPLHFQYIKPHTRRQKLYSLCTARSLIIL